MNERTKKYRQNAIKIIGVGGGGSNAVSLMFNKNIPNSDFIICNTDYQAMHNSNVPNKIQIGQKLTEGLGAGADPEMGESSAIESREELLKIITDGNPQMIILVAGMGGGTGTGATPIIAKIAKELGILTIGIVTKPFQFEGKLRIGNAEEGIEKLKMQVDSLIVINAK